MGESSEEEGTVVFEQAAGELCAGCGPALEGRRQAGGFWLWDCAAVISA